MNEEVRAFAKKHRLKMWEVAYEAGISEPTLCRWMRVELTPDHRERITKAMHRLAERRIKSVV